MSLNSSEMQFSHTVANTAAAYGTGPTGVCMGWNAHRNAQVCPLPLPPKTKARPALCVRECNVVWNVFVRWAVRRRACVFVLPVSLQRKPFRQCHPVCHPERRVEQLYEQTHES